MADAEAASLTIERLKKRPDFLAAATARAAPKGAVLIQARHRADDSATVRVGFTATRKIGGAVVRNRMKRRFRALAREIVPAKGMAGADHVMIGRSKGVEREFFLLRTELADALDSLRKR